MQQLSVLLILGTRSKNFKTPFFSRYPKFLSWGDSNRSKTTPKFYSFFFNKYGCQRSSKFLHTRGHYWPTDWAMTKIFMSIYPRTMMKKRWKFQVNIMSGLRFIEIWLKNSGKCWPACVQIGLFCTHAGQQLPEFFS